MSKSIIKTLLFCTALILGCTNTNKFRCYRVQTSPFEFCVKKEFIEKNFPRSMPFDYKTNEIYLVDSVNSQDIHIVVNVNDFPSDYTKLDSSNIKFVETYWEAKYGKFLILEKKVSPNKGTVSFIENNNFHLEIGVQLNKYEVEYHYRVHYNDIKDLPKYKEKGETFFKNLKEVEK